MSTNNPDPRIRAGTLALRELKKLRTRLVNAEEQADRARERLSDLFHQVDAVIRECEAIAKESNHAD